jgi:hypothetical protein
LRFGAAIGLVVLIAGALIVRLRIHDSAGFLLGDAVLSRSPGRPPCFGERMFEGPEAAGLTRLENA